MEMGLSTYYRYKKKIENMKLERMHFIADHFQELHLEKIDRLELIDRLMWQEFGKETQPYRRVKILETIANADEPIGYDKFNRYAIIDCEPAKGVLYITEDNPAFISGQVRMRAKNEGRYPFHYLEMIDKIFGYESNTIEVCSRSVEGGNKGGSCFTVDINPSCKPDLVTNGETLKGIPSNEFDRWRCDPPYNEQTAIEMYGTELPKTSELLKAGARVCKQGALMFLLLGPTNYQSCPAGVVRVGAVVISVIPNNEWRTLNIFLKIRNEDSERVLKSRPRPKMKNQSLGSFY
jgi:hypothetical protein